MINLFLLECYLLSYACESKLAFYPAMQSSCMVSDKTGVRYLSQRNTSEIVDLYKHL